MKYSSRYLIQLKNTDLTGKIPVQSERGNNYILVEYHDDTNNILTTPLKNRTGPCILSDITKIHDRLRERVLTPKLHIMDNEVSEDLKKYFEYSDKQLQLVPPQMHRRNSVERSVRTFKNHFIDTLCCQFLRSHNCETRIFFSQNVPKSQSHPRRLSFDRRKKY